MAKSIDFWTLLKLTQEFVSQHYAAALTDKAKLPQLKAYIDKYLRDNDYHVDNFTTKELIDKLYCEMAEYSVLTPYLGSEKLEEINVNGWDDIALTLLDGSIVKLKEHFHSPQHAVDIIKRLLHHSGMIIDNATPMVAGTPAEQYPNHGAERTYRRRGSRCCRLDSSASPAENNRRQPDRNGICHR